MENIDRNTNKPGSKPYLFIKRCFDILFSLIMLLPLLFLTIIIKLLYVLKKDYASIFYTQRRVGLNGKEFVLRKFRSMEPGSQHKLDELLKDPAYKKEWDENHKLEDDPRITKIGYFLRRSSIDEFPQFINVLKNDMSVIGPRPLAIGELEQHGGDKKYESVKPGITGWWGCNGRNNVSYDERLKLEYYYIDNFSFRLDLQAFVKTIVCIFKRTGAK